MHKHDSGASVLISPHTIQRERARKEKETSSSTQSLFSVFCLVSVFYYSRHFNVPLSFAVNARPRKDRIA